MTFITRRNFFVALSSFALAIIIISVYAATKTFAKKYTTSESTIILAKTYYTTPSKEISFYLENIVLDYSSTKGRIGVNIPNGTEGGSSSGITPENVKDGSYIYFSAEVSDDKYDTINKKNSKIIVSNEQNTNPIKVLNIGDSLTARSWFANPIIKSTAFKGITFLGNRTSYHSYEPIQNEGQGGWTMDSFHRVDFSSYISPFMQPAHGDQLFYGSANFWMDANGEKPSYNAYNFLKTKGLFDPATGLLKNPKIGDLMAKGEDFVVWDGKEWSKDNRTTEKDFEFNFSKYRSAWSVERPDIVHILLGTNGFYATTGTHFKKEYKIFKRKYDTMISSIRKDSPNAKIIIGTPISTGRQGDNGNLVSERANNAYKLLAESLIRDYDNRQPEGIYLLDYHAVLDREHGFDATQVKPFSDYQGNKTIPYMMDISHPSFGGFDQMGNMYLGIIQHLR